MKRKEFDLMDTLFWKTLLRVIKTIMVSCSVISTGCIVYAVVLRYVFGQNFYGSDEVILLFAFWLYFMGAVYGSFEDSHIKADLVIVYIKNIYLKDLVCLIAQGLTIVINSMVLVWAWQYFLRIIEKPAFSTGLSIPLVIPKSAIFVGLLLMLFFHVYFFQRHLRAFIREGHYSDPQEGDYVSVATKNKFPNIGIPLKHELPSAALDNDSAVKGGDE